MGIGCSATELHWRESRESVNCSGIALIAVPLRVSRDILNAKMPDRSKKIQSYDDALPGREELYAQYDLGHQEIYEQAGGIDDRRHEGRTEDCGITITAR